MDDEKQDKSAAIEQRRRYMTLMLGRYLRILSEVLPMPNGQDLTRDKILAYVVALEDLVNLNEPNLEPLEYALQRCLKECDFFPSAPEIRRRVEEWSPEEDRRITAERVRKTIAAARAGDIPDEPPVPSVLDRIEAGSDEYNALMKREVQALAKVKDLQAQGILSREQLLKAGLEQPRQLSPPEFEARLRELERQKEELLKQQKPEGEA